MPAPTLRDLLEDMDEAKAPNPLVDGEMTEALEVYASTFLRAVDKEHLPLEEAQAKARRAVRLWKDERLRQEQALLTRKTY